VDPAESLKRQQATGNKVIMVEDIEAKANDWGTPHAFHLNLPPNHIDDDGVPFITKFANKKARMIVDLAMSINLTEDMFAQADDDDDDDDDTMDIEDVDQDLGDQKETLVSMQLNQSQYPATHVVADIN
jgi:hypothetical protein